jgi:hypothetical protein
VLKDGGVLFVDEINTAPPAIQSALLGLIQLRTLGDFTFGPGVRILAAANEVSDAAGGWELPRSVDNRLVHLTFEGLAADEWAQALIGGFGRGRIDVIDRAAEEHRVMAAWPALLAESRGLVAGFVRARPDLLYKKPEAGSNAKAWPSHRTWEYVTVALTAARMHRLTEIDADQLLTGLVGTGPTVELRRWIAEADLPNPHDVIDGRVKFEIDGVRLDRSLAVLSACAGAVAVSPKAQQADRADRMWELLTRAADVSLSLVVGPATLLLSKGLRSKTYVATMLKITDAVRVAGVGSEA